MVVETIEGSADLGHLIRRYRDEQGLTQTELAKLTGVQRAYISSIELGRIALVYPAIFNSLRRVLGFPGWEALEAMGYQTDRSEEGVSPLLLQLIRSLTPEQQRTLYPVLRSLIKLREDNDHED